MGGSLLQNGGFSIAKWGVLYCTPNRNPQYINKLQRCFFFILFIPFIKRINRGCIADATPYFIFLFLSLYGLKIGVVCPSSWYTIHAYDTDIYPSEVTQNAITGTCTPVFMR